MSEQWVRIPAGAPSAPQTQPSFAQATRAPGPPPSDGQWMRVQAPQDQPPVFYPRSQARPYQRKPKEDKCDHVTPGSDIHLTIDTLTSAQLNAGREPIEILRAVELGQILKSENRNPRQKYCPVIQVQTSSIKSPLNHMGLSALFAIVYDSWKKTHAKLLNGTETLVTRTSFFADLLS